MAGWTKDDSENELEQAGDKWEWRVPQNKDEHQQETVAPGDLLIKPEDLDAVPRKTPSGLKGIQTGEQEWSYQSQPDSTWTVTDSAPIDYDPRDPFVDNLYSVNLIDEQYFYGDDLGHRPFLEGNTWSLSTWFQPSTLKSINNVFTVGSKVADATSDDISRIRVQQLTNAGFKVQLWDQNGTLNKEYTLDTTLLIRTWYQLSITWDGALDVSGGTPLRIWLDGVEATVGGALELTKTTDTIGTIQRGSATSIMQLGEFYNSDPFGGIGHHYSLAIWSTALSSDEVGLIYNDGTEYELDYNRGSYASASSLEHWYRFGLVPASPLLEHTGQSVAGYTNQFVGSENFRSGGPTAITASDVTLDAPGYPAAARPDFVTNTSGSFEINRDELLKTSPVVPATSFAGNSWSISTWVKHVTGVETASLVTVGAGTPGTTNTDAILIRVNATREWEFRLYLAGASSPLLRKAYVVLPDANPNHAPFNPFFDLRAPVAISLDTWYQITCSWDGSSESLRIWIDGVEATEGIFQYPGVPSLEKDSDYSIDTMDATQLREIQVGPTAIDPTDVDIDADTIRHYSLATWSEALSNSDAVAIYNDGVELDLTYETDAYSSACYLTHWYRFGLDSIEPGREYPTDNHPFVSSGTVPVTTDDVVADYPGGPVYNIPFTTNTNAVDLVGSANVGKSFETGVKTVRDITAASGVSAFTSSIWVKPTTGITDTTFLDIYSDVTGYRVSVTQQGQASWRFEINDDYPNQAKRRYDLILDPSLGTFPLSEWYQLTFTWDSTLDSTGEPLRIWVNGVEATTTGTPRLVKITSTVGTALPFTNYTKINVGNSGTVLTDSIYVYSYALWGKVLSPSEVTAIYNSGEEFRLDIDGTGYSSAGLYRWYRFGLDERDVHIGRNYPLNTEVLASNGAEDITSADLITDIPTL